MYCLSKNHLRWFTKKTPGFFGGWAEGPAQTFGSNPLQNPKGFGVTFGLGITLSKTPLGFWMHSFGLSGFARNPKHSFGLPFPLPLPGKARLKAGFNLALPGKGLTWLCQVRVEPKNRGFLVFQKANFGPGSFAACSPSRRLSKRQSLLDWKERPFGLLERPKKPLT